MAFAKNNIDFLTEAITNNIHWNIIGDKSIQGKDHFVEVLEQRKNSTVTEVHITNIITHGNTGAVNGTLIFENQQEYAFCDVYTFNSAGKNSNIKEITSYVIKTS